MNWDLLDAEEVLRCHVFNVRRHRSRSPRTGAVHDFDVIDTRDWVNVVPITADRQLILVRQFRHGIGAVTVEVPAGIIDPADPSPAAAAARELREETGYAASELVSLAVIHPNPAMQNNRCHIFLARGAQRVAEPCWDGTEDLELELRPVTQLDTLLASGEITHAMALISLLLARQLV
jgi:ADP-ribose pyrophosphatase